MNRTAAIILSLFLLTALAGGLLALAQAAGDPPTELYVRTIPAGAEVFIDGKKVGVSDDLFEVKPGTRKVKVELSGYEPAVKKAIVPESRIERVVFELEKPEGTKVSEPDAASKKMTALVEDFFRHNFRDITDRETIEWGEVEDHENGHKSIRYKYLATIWGKKKQLMNQRFTFDSDGKFVKYENVVEVPRPVKIVPAPGARDVDPDLKEIRITFDRDMEPGEFGWWSWGADHSLNRAAKGRWIDRRTYVQPVALAKGKAYSTAFNWEGGRHIRSVDGIPAPPTRIYFCMQGASPELLAMLTPPKVTKFSIANGSENVSPRKTVLSVTFDQPLGIGWWHESSGRLKIIPDHPSELDYWSSDKRTLSVRAELEPGRRYTIHLNEGGLDTVPGREFRNALGLALAPTTWEFSTAREKPETEDSDAKKSLLKNPGAESGDKTPDAWEQGANIPGVTYSWDKNVAHEGKASLCIERTADRYFPIAGWFQEVEREGDAPTVELSAYVKAEKMTKAVLDVIFLDKDGEWISHKWAAYIGAKESGDPPADHDWKEYSGKIEVPPGTVKYRVGLQVYGPGKVWFDDVRLDEVVESSGAASKELIALVEDFFRHNFRDVTARETIEWGDVQEHADGNRSIRYMYLATIWGKKKLVMNQVFTFDADGKYVKYENVEGFPKGEETSDAAEAATDEDLDRREIGKKAKDFPEEQDLSTPESAWAAYTRSSGNMEVEGVVALSWVKIDPAEMERFWNEGDPQDIAVYNKAQLESECVEVLTLPENLAAVISRLEFPEGKGRHPYSVRFFGLRDGKWKNLGEDRCPTLEAARENVRRKVKAVFNRFERIGVELTSEESAKKAAENRGVPKPPQAVEVVPAIAATDVDPALKEIRATFDRDMDTEGMSWCGGGEHFPKIDGEGKWIDKRTCVLPVKLEEGKAYRLALNWEKYRNFQAAEGVPVIPTAVYFCTKGAGPELLAQMTPPKVVSLSIENGAKDISPGRTKLSVTFDQPMGGGMSWCNGKDTPKMEPVDGSAWSEDKKTCSIMAVLEPGHDYVVYLNSESHGNFMNEVGVSLEPVVWKFWVCVPFDG